MYKLITLFFLIALPGPLVLAQGTSKSETLKKVKTVEQAELFLKKSNSKNGSIGRFNSIIDSVEYREITRDYQIGDIFFGRRMTYKILQKEKEIIYRCQYIYLPAATYSKEKADSIRTEIVTKFKTGISFEKLTAQYLSSDPEKKGGDSGWSHKEKFGNEFVQILASKGRGQIFTFDDPSQKGYYVVLKTHSEMQSDSWVYITLR